jgi:hypothetical protein
MINNKMKRNVIYLYCILVVLIAATGCTKKYTANITHVVYPIPVNDSLPPFVQLIDMNSNSWRGAKKLLSCKFLVLDDSGIENVRVDNTIVTDLDGDSVYDADISTNTSIPVYVSDKNVPPNSKTYEFTNVNPVNYALIIGINRYDNYPDLTYATGDATKLYTILSQKYRYETENMYLLKDANKSTIDSCLTELSKKIKENDNLLVFFAGHGDPNFRLFPGDVSFKDRQIKRGTYLSILELISYFNDTHANQLLVISDACYSGTFTEVKIESDIKGKCRKVITSGTSSQQVPDESVFFKYVLKALNENTKKYLSAEELYESLPDRVNKYSNPQMKSIGSSPGKFYFYRK